MDINITATIIVAAILVQAIIEALKPLLDGIKHPAKAAMLHYLMPLVIGLVVAITGQLDLAAAVGLTMPAAVSYTITGVIIARGSNFVHDLLSKLQANYRPEKQ